MELWTARSKIASLQPTQQRTAITPGSDHRSPGRRRDGFEYARRNPGLGAVYRDDGSADYDIDFPSTAAYNFVTIRQVIGFVDWMANAGERWNDGLRRAY